MIVNTSRFGEVDIPDDSVITFPEGLPGFEGNTYVLIHSDENPEVNWLQSASDPDVAVIIMDPVNFRPDYELAPRPEELKLIKAANGHEKKVVYRIIIRSGEKPGQLYLNLFAPLIFNVADRLGMQLALVGSDFSIREVWNAPDETDSEAQKQTG
jgi:flagellar assembly factor FliW